MRRFARFFLVLAAACSSSDAGVVVTLEPAIASVVPLSELAFEVRVEGTFGDDVTWTLSGPGTLTAAGVYTAPDVVPFAAENVIVVTATSRATPSASASSTLRVVPAPISPARGPSSGGTRVEVTGFGFVSGTQVFVGAQAASVTVLGPTLLEFLTPPAAIGIADIRIDVPGIDPVVFRRAFRYGATHLSLPLAETIRICGDSTAAFPLDADGDGDSDVVVQCAVTEQYALLENVGFGELVQVDSISSPYVDRLVVFDIDGDGDDDLLGIATGTGEPVRILLIEGARFSQSLITSVLSGLAVLPGHIDTDGSPDFLVVDGSGAVFAHFGTGPLSFDSGVVVGSSLGFTLAAPLLDIDGDGDDDFVFARGNELGVLRNDGGVAFPEVAAIPLLNPVSGLSVTDVDADSFGDVVISHFGSAGFGLVRSSGGQLQKAVAEFVPTSAASTTVFPGGDFDSDGRDDLIITKEFNPTKFSAVYVDVAGFSEVTMPGLGQGANGFAGFDRDVIAVRLGSIDLIAHDSGRIFGPQKPSVGPVLSTAPFSEGTETRFALALNGAIGVLLADGTTQSIPVTGVSPLVAAVVAVPVPAGTRFFGAGHGENGQDMPLVVWFSDFADDAFGEIASFTLGSGGGNAHVVGLGAADVDGDVLPDLVLRISTDIPYAVEVRLCRNAGPAGCAGGPVVLAGGGVNFVTGFAVADFDLDGEDEVALSDYANSRVLILEGTGQLLDEISLEFPPLAIQATDFDLDRVPDLAVLSEGSDQGVPFGSLAALAGFGDGTFSPAAATRVGNPRGVLAIADFDGDGLPDAFVPMDSGHVNLLRGTGAFAFFEPRVYFWDSSPLAIAPADFDGDGLPDIARLSFGSELVIYRNLSR